MFMFGANVNVYVLKYCKCAGLNHKVLASRLSKEHRQTVHHILQPQQHCVAHAPALIRATLISYTTNNNGRRFSNTCFDQYAAGLAHLVVIEPSASVLTRGRGIVFESCRTVVGGIWIESYKANKEIQELPDYEYAIVCTAGVPKTFGPSCQYKYRFIEEKNLSLVRHLSINPEIRRRDK